MLGRHRRSDLSSPSAVLALLSLLSCAAAAPPPPPPAPAPPAPAVAPAVAAPEPSDAWLVPSPLIPLVSSSAAPAVAAPLTPLEALARSVGDDWVRDQGCGGLMETAATDCTGASTRLRDERTDGDLRSAVLELEGQGNAWASAAHVVLQMGSGPHAIFPLGGAWSSGVGGTSHRLTIEEIQVRDVFGDAAPEWWAEIEIAAHDSDMGLCRVTGTVERALVLCTPDAGRFACFHLPLASIAYQEITDTGSAGDPCERPRRSAEGYAGRATVARGHVEIVPVARPVNERALTKRTRAPFSGRVPLKRLLERAPAENLCVSRNLPC